MSFLKFLLMWLPLVFLMKLTVFPIQVKLKNVCQSANGLADPCQSKGWADLLLWSFFPFYSLIIVSYNAFITLLSNLLD